MVVLATMGLALATPALSLSGFGMQCSAACGSCCVRGGAGDNWLTPDADGYCVDGAGARQCRLGSGLCQGADMAVPECASVPLATIAMVEPFPNDPVGNTFLHEGMELWDTGLDARSSLHALPPYYLNGWTALVPREKTVLGGTEVRYTCPEGPAGACDAVVFMYECSPCEAKKGDVPATLAKAGFERSSCGPHFKTGKAHGLGHHMTSWRKTVPAGETLSIEVKEDAEWVVFALSQGSSLVCPMLEVDEACEDPALHGFCQWKQGTCHTNMCRLSAGPSLGCAPATCVGKDFESATPDMDAPMMTLDK